MDMADTVIEILWLHNLLLAIGVDCTTVNYFFAL